MKKNVAKAIVGGIMGVSLVVGLLVSLTPMIKQNADLVWPENAALVN